ncbi:uncharacterized protein B0I36DRAFT_361599 [Microdochium trichocladiopsis]|uniref:Uncharacterized protein n=1 Tax=Microdochium trichocladiopsis TaxID=1682393 RepID=A0A9P8Y8B2_9PEZI|nr:uncharacterized protein B0I36DRAFT_361599 [Microdochium trichocladiopsis]KAH7032838.1 hypothetical protein B0I36DRAFT_361599 [Microdochium trichocladiopsis]
MRRRTGIEDLRASYTYTQTIGPAFAVRHPYPQHLAFSDTTTASSYSTATTASSHGYAPRWRRPSRSSADGQYGQSPPFFASVCVQTVDQLQEAAAESFPGRRGSRWSHRTALIVPDLSSEISRSVSWRSAGPLVVCFRVRRYDYGADLRFDDAAAWRRIRQLAAEKGADGVEREIRGMEGRLLVCWVVKRQGRIIDPRLEFPHSGDNAFERRRERRDANSAGLSSLLAGPYSYSRDYDIINEQNPLAYLFLPNPYKLPPRR